MSNASATAASTARQTAVQPVCLGRFVIDLPAGFVRTGDGAYKYRTIAITKPTPISHEDFKKKVDQLEALLKATKHEKSPSLLLKEVSSNADSRVLAYWEKPHTEGLVNVDGHLWSDGQYFLFKVEVDDDKYEQATSAMSRLLSQVLSRPESDVPTAPGFCFNGGFIVDDKWKAEEVLAGFDLAEHPDVHISVNFYPLAKSRHDKPLLDRAEGGLMKAANLLSSMHTLRKGDRKVGGFAGQEYLITAPNESQQRAHMFTWETQGDGTLEGPFITIEMTSGNRDDNGNPLKASLTDEQALKLWDSIVSTFRVRPTSTPPAKVSEGPTPRTPLGELAATGRVCAQTGWWQCIEEALPIKGGREQFFREGEAMPRVTLLGAPSWLDRIKGDQPEHRTATVWKLMRYEEGASVSSGGAESRLEDHPVAHHPTVSGDIA